MVTAVSVALIAMPYLLGSIPTAVWVSRGIYGVDIRTQGSNNAGSTNMFRMLGRKAGIITQVVDIGKGALAAVLPLLVMAVAPEQPYMIQHWELEMQCFFSGMLAVIGHIYPIFAGFRGGKGVNTLLGMMLAVNPLAALACIVVWLLVLYASRYVAVASMLAVGAYPLYLLVKALATGQEANLELVLLGTGMFLLVVFTHRSNIARLLNGTEVKNSWLRKG